MSSYTHQNDHEPQTPVHRPKLPNQAKGRHIINDHTQNAKSFVTYVRCEHGVLHFVRNQVDTSKIDRFSITWVGIYTTQTQNLMNEYTERSEKNACGIDGGT